MKLTIGKTNILTGPNLDQRRISETIQKTIMKSMAAEIIDVSAFRIAQLTRDLQMVATREAHQLFQYVVGVMDSGANHVGDVIWPDLTASYLRFKDKYFLGKVSHGGNRASPADTRRAFNQSNRFFRLSGRLRTYFRAQGNSIVDTRFGGVSITTSNTSRDRTLVSHFDSNGRLLLADINVKIFPRIAPALMPMLASGRWSAVPHTSEFEKAMLPTDAARKLSGGKHGPYRPLVLPIVQFFILNRIPGALRAEIKRSFGTTFKSDALSS